MYRKYGGYLKFLEVCFRVIDQGETSGLSTSELSAETECLDRLLGSLVHSGKTGTDIILGKIGFGGVKNVDDLQSCYWGMKMCVRIVYG